MIPSFPISPPVAFNMFSGSRAWALSLVASLCALMSSGCGGTTSQSANPQDPASIDDPLLGEVGEGGALSAELPLYDRPSCEGKRLDGVLGKLWWAAPHDGVLAHLEGSQQEAYRQRAAATRDPGKQDKALQEARAASERVKKSYRSLQSPDATRLQASLLGSEFAPDAGESLLHVADERATRYYFFADDQLYKIAVVYRSSYLADVGFDQFVLSIAEKYGKPASTELDDQGYLTQASWTDGCGTRLRAHEFADAYGTFLLVFADAARDEALAERHAQARASAPVGNAALEELTQDGGGELGSAAGDILHNETRVHLEGGEEPSGEGAAIDVGSTEAKTGEPQKSRRRARRGRKDFKDLESIKPTDGEIFIY